MPVILNPMNKLKPNKRQGELGLFRAGLTEF